MTKWFRVSYYWQSSNEEWISISIKKSKKFMMIDLKELNTKEQYQKIYLIAKSS